MRIDIITIFPQFFESPLDTSFLKKSQVKGLVKVNLHNLRDFTKNRHRQVDDTPYGGGSGMVMKPEPFFEAIFKITGQKSFPLLKGLKKDLRVILFSPQGEPLNQAKVKELAKEKWLILLCGRYEGVDARVGEYLATDEISLGDYILSGGEAAALALMEAAVRLIPGVVGKASSLEEESFEAGFLEYPQYTRPQEYLGMKVPKILLSGDHQMIASWRQQKALERTQKKRPDLLKKGKK